LFYDKNIPVLAFFTGLHEDYHMPSDDADKINAAAGAAIATLAGEVVRSSRTRTSARPSRGPARRRRRSVAVGDKPGAPPDPHADATAVCPTACFSAPRRT
jgi:hypothetical protein